MSAALFTKLNSVLDVMEAHRPDDLIAALHGLATRIQQATFPELLEVDGALVCPYCDCKVEVDEYNWMDIRAYDIAIGSYPLELINLDSGMKVIGSHDESANWETMHFEHACGGAVAFSPASIEMELV
jgi:hypothetical protein